MRLGFRRRLVDVGVRLEEGRLARHFLLRAQAPAGAHRRSAATNPLHGPAAAEQAAEAIERRAVLFERQPLAGKATGRQAPLAGREWILADEELDLRRAVIPDDDTPETRPLHQRFDLVDHVVDRVDAEHPATVIARPAIRHHRNGFVEPGIGTHDFDLETSGTRRCRSPALRLRLRLGLRLRLRLRLGLRLALDDRGARARCVRRRNSRPAGPAICGGAVCCTTCASSWATNRRPACVRRCVPAGRERDVVSYRVGIGADVARRLLGGGAAMHPHP